MSARRRVLSAPAVVAVAALMAAAMVVAAPPPEAVPRPRMDNFEAGVQRYLEAAHDALDALRLDPSTERATLAAAHGELGRLYLVHGFGRTAEPLFEIARRLSPEDGRWAYFLAFIADDQGRFEEALARIEGVMEAAPEYLPAWILRARAALELDELEVAEESLSRAADLAPEEAAVLFARGELAARRGDQRSAIELFRATLERQPEATFVHHSLGMAYRELGELDRARAQLALYRPDGKIELADPLIDALSELVDSAQIHHKRGLAALGVGAFESALAELRRATELDEGNFLIHYDLGRALAQAGREEEALTPLRRAAQLNPNFRDGQYNLAVVLARSGQLIEAAAAYAAAAELDPSDHGARHHQARALAAAGIVSEAVKVLLLHIAEAPDDGVALALLGELEAGRGNDAKALGLLERAVLLAPDDAETRRQLGKLHGRAGNFVEASLHLARVVELEPSSEADQFGYATALLLAGRDAEAQGALEAALTHIPDSVPLTHALARLLAASGNDAVRDGARALELAQSVFQRRQTLDHIETVAMALAELGRFDEAAAIEQRVAGEADRAAQPAIAERARARAAIYERGQPLRAPWLGEG